MLIDNRYILDIFASFTRHTAGIESYRYYMFDTHNYACTFPWQTYIYIYQMEGMSMIKYWTFGDDINSQRTFKI